MKSQSKFEILLKNARVGNKQGEEDFLSELLVRFVPLVTSELRKYLILEGFPDIEDKSRKICQATIANLKRLYPMAGTEWSLKRAMIVLRNDIDDEIIKTLAELAKNGNIMAENWLFRKLREKLTNRITLQKRRFLPYEPQNQ